MGEEKQGASWDAQLLVKTEDKSIPWKGLKCVSDPTLTGSLEGPQPLFLHV